MSEALLKVRKKGVTILPKRLREAAGIMEDTEVRAKASAEGILLRPLSKDPVTSLQKLLPDTVGKPSSSTSSSTVRIRKLRKKIDHEVRGKGK